ncbi:MAG TPA: hypothetical protein VMW69_08880, partial [Spirochaetia bacterium]|nr:hypothetical protein [Spirochaetia bacterium]
MKDLFSAKRLGRLFLKDLSEGYRTVLILVGAVTGVLLLNLLIGGLVGGNDIESSGRLVHGSGVNSTTHLVFFTVTLLIGGFILSSRAFPEIHAKNRNHEWLMLPASRFEKYLTRLVLTTIGVGIGTVVYFVLFTLLAAGLSALLFGRAYQIFNPFDGAVWMLVLN